MEAVVGRNTTSISKIQGREREKEREREKNNNSPILNLPGVFGRGDASVHHDLRKKRECEPQFMKQQVIDIENSAEE